MSMCAELFVLRPCQLYIMAADSCGGLPHLPVVRPLPVLAKPLCTEVWGLPTPQVLAARPLSERAGALAVADF